MERDICSSWSQIRVQENHLIKPISLTSRGTMSLEDIAIPAAN